LLASFPVMMTDHFPLTARLISNREWALTSWRSPTPWSSALVAFLHVGLPVFSFSVRQPLLSKRLPLDRCSGTPDVFWRHSERLDPESFKSKPTFQSPTTFYIPPLSPPTGCRSASAFSDRQVLFRRKDHPRTRNTSSTSPLDFSPYSVNGPSLSFGMGKPSIYPSVFTRPPSTGLPRIFSL